MKNRKARAEELYEFRSVLSASACALQAAAAANKRQPAKPNPSVRQKRGVRSGRPLSSLSAHV